VTQKFNVVREDFLFDYGDKLSSVFKLSPRKGDEFLHYESIVETHEAGYDFVSECYPSIQMSAIAPNLFEDVGLSLKDVELKISIKDPGLHSRVLFLRYCLDDIKDGMKIEIPLTNFKEMAFYTGFSIGINIGVINTDHSNTSNPLWHKSRNIYSHEYQFKTSFKESAFNIKYGLPVAGMSDKAAYFIHWFNDEVSSRASDEVFEIIVNEKLRDQNIRLERNRHFGQFSSRLILSDVFLELILTCLSFADLDADPVDESLHKVVETFLSGYGVDFNDSVSVYKGENHMLKNKLTMIIRSYVQEFFEVFDSFEQVSFGGYRGSESE